MGERSFQTEDGRYWLGKSSEINELKLDKYDIKPTIIRWGTSI